MRFLVPLLCLAGLAVGGLVRAQPAVTPGAGVPPELPASAPVNEASGPELGAAVPDAVSTPAVSAAPVPGAGSPDQTELAARLQALERLDRLDDSVRRPLDFARAALARSRASHELGDNASELRTRQLARAAVELAEARLRLLRERALFVATQARRNVATADEATARRALERERARALELQRESAAP